MSNTRIFSKNNIPSGYKETILKNNLNLKNIKLVLVFDDEKEINEIVKELENYMIIPTITEEYLYIILK